MDEPFVQFLIPCKCGVDLQIHGRHFKDGRYGSRNTVTCPKCKTEHGLPTIPLSSTTETATCGSWASTSWVSVSW